MLLFGGDKPPPYRPIAFTPVPAVLLSSVKDVDLHNMEKAMPAFCTIVFMPFTYSIANGIALG